MVSPRRLIRSPLGNEPLEQVANLDLGTVRVMRTTSRRNLPIPAAVEQAQEQEARRGSRRYRRRMAARSSGGDDCGPAARSTAAWSSAGRPVRFRARGGSSAGLHPSIQSWIKARRSQSTWFDPTRGIRPPPSLEMR